jgi:hypothetical protein
MNEERKGKCLRQVEHANYYADNYFEQSSDPVDENVVNSRNLAAW